MTKNVLLLGCAYPPELPYFARGVARTGARVFGVDQVPESHLPPMTRASLSGYCQVQSLFDEDQSLDIVRRWAGSASFDRVESLWEPCVLLAAKLREAFGAPGMKHEQVVRFRDKDKMKQAVTDAGLRTPRHQRANHGDDAFAAAEEVGYPVCLKPIAGAGSENTFRVDSTRDMERALAKAGREREYNVEEFIEAEEYTYDTICVDGRVVYENMSWYRPRPLVGRSVEWISPQTVTLRDIERPELAAGRVLGENVLKALTHDSGFTHMEWYLKSDGEAVFGEIAARPPGAHTVDTMNFASDIDLFTGWAEAVVNGKWELEFERLYNCAIIFKRAQGQGRIQRIEGLDRLLGSYGEHIAAMELLPVGAHRRDWVKTLLSDGFVFVRHPDLDTTCEIADRVGTDLQMYAG
jgi:biotin carboxylase